MSWNLSHPVYREIKPYCSNPIRSYLEFAWGDERWWKEIDIVFAVGTRVVLCDEPMFDSWSEGTPLATSYAIVINHTFASPKNVVLSLVECPLLDEYPIPEEFPGLMAKAGWVKENPLL